MPTEFQKVMDLLLAKFRDVFVFIDDFIKKNHRNQERTFRQSAGSFKNTR